MKILTLIDAFLPGFRYGGPLRTIAGMVEQMPSDFQFWILTRDRDLGDTSPYAGIERDRWVERAGAHVQYLSPGRQNRAGLSAVVRNLEPDAVYANSLFSALTRSYLAARRLGQVERHPLLLAPRGELSPQALRRKRYKKWPFLRVAARSGLLDDASWQASTELERDEMARAFEGPLRGVRVREVFVARDLVGKAVVASGRTRPKGRGVARMVFLSRIVPNKNLLHAIEALVPVKGEIDLDVYGPVEDPGYWKTCLRSSQRLPPNVRVRYCGEIPHERVGVTLADYDFLVLPTRFENFGHVLMEALNVGLPIVVSDETSWRGLEARRAGFDLPLADLPLWSRTLQRCVDMDDVEHRSFRAGALQAGNAFADVAGAVRQCERMLRRVAGARAR